MLQIPLVTDVEGKILRMLMDSVSFMKNLPDGVVPPTAVDPDVNSSDVDSDLPPSSPLHWSPSSPPRWSPSPLPPTRHQVLQPPPPTHPHPRPRPVPVPTRTYPRQPTENVVRTRTSRPEPVRSLTTRPDSYRHESHKAKCKRDDKSEGEDSRNSRRTKRSAMQYVFLPLFLLHTYSRSR
jgi:hypothetical protein